VEGGFGVWFSVFHESIISLVSCIIYCLKKEIYLSGQKLK